MPHTSAEIQAAIDQLAADIAVLHQLVQSNSTTDVVTDGGVVPSYAKLVATLLAQTLLHLPPSSFPPYGLVVDNSTSPGELVLLENGINIIDSMPFQTGTDPNENFQDGRQHRRAFMLDENVILDAHQFWMISDNPLIFPGEFTIKGTWAAGESAHCVVAWGTTTRTFIYTVQSGDGPQQIANALNAQMLADPVFAATPIMIPAVGPRNGGFAWHLNVPWSTFTASPSITLSHTGTVTTSGIIQETLQPSNILDTPAATFVLAHAVPGRQAQHDDLIGEFVFLGQNDTITSVDDGSLRQIYYKCQGYIDSPASAAPIGKLQWQRADPGPNNVVNMMHWRLGILMCDSNGATPSGGTVGDMGVGTINVPSAGGYYVNGVKGVGALQEFADDAAANSGGIPLTGLYRSGSVVKIRVT